MKLTGNAKLYITLLAIMSAVIVISVLMESFESKLLPLLFSGIIFILSAIGLWNEIATSRKRQAAVTKEEKKEPPEETWGGYLINGAWFGGFILAIYLLGIMIAIPLFTLSYMRRLGARWAAVIFWTILAPALIYGVFEVALGIDLYRGLLLTWLGY